MSFVSPWWFSALVDSLTRAIASASMFSCLTAYARLDSEGAVKTQLEDWLEKPQRHECLAVGDVASPYDAKTWISHDGSGSDLSGAASGGATGSLVKRYSDMDDRLEKLQGHEWLAVGDVESPYDAKTWISHDGSGDDPSRAASGGATGSLVEGLVKVNSDMDDCLEKLQGHDWLAVGDVASPVRPEKKMTPEDNGEDLTGRMLAGLVASTTKMEDHHREDGTDKPAKHKSLALREYGCRAPAMSGQFFADIHEILGGKTE